MDRPQTKILPLSNPQISSQTPLDKLMFSRYNRLLHLYPYRTNALTAGALWFTGDVIAQKATAKEDQPLDFKRLGVMTGFGIGLAGPIYTAWYGLLDKMVNRLFTKQVAKVAVQKVKPNQLQVAKYSTVALVPSMNVYTPLLSTKWKITLTKTLADLALFDPPYLSFFFLATNVLSGNSLSDATKQLKQELVHTYKVDVAIWTPIQLLNFRFVPVMFQPLLVNSVNVGWNAYLSFIKHDHH